MSKIAAVSARQVIAVPPETTADEVWHSGRAKQLVDPAPVDLARR
jgi:hypothetical protein